jgi:Holliday junction resolvase RusA-like endonuclease
MDNTIIMLNVEGTPRPQPRPRLCRGRVVSTADANARRWQGQVAGAAKVAFEAHGAMEGPLEVCFSFQFATPKADRHGKPHTFRPDADNLAKLALDAVMKAGLFKDDSQVSMMVVRKTWAKDGGMVMTLTADQRDESTAPAEVMPHPRWVN